MGVWRAFGQGTWDSNYLFTGTKVYQYFKSQYGDMYMYHMNISPVMCVCVLSIGYFLKQASPSTNSNMLNLQASKRLTQI